MSEFELKSGYDMFMIQLLGMPIIKSDLFPRGKAIVLSDKIIVGTYETEVQKWIREIVYEVFHQGPMLKWYEYIGEGDGYRHPLGL
jgi:hypothetical protein